MKNVILLAAGRSSRFGRNKLEEKFNGVSLPRFAAEFAYSNGCDNLYLTLSRSAVKTDGTDVYHPVLEELHSAGIYPKVAFQDETTYGPGAAVSLWAPVIDGPVTVLFGDNFYGGRLQDSFLDELDGDFGGVIFTKKNLPLHPRNLQLAVVRNEFVIEKPHGQLEGDFFCGFVRFPARYLKSLGQLKKSERGEVEITEMINFMGERVAWNLDEIGIGWGDITYESDVSNMRNLVAKYERK